MNIQDFMKREVPKWVQEGLVSKEIGDTLLGRYEKNIANESDTALSTPIEGQDEREHIGLVIIAMLLILGGLTVLLNTVWSYLPLMGQYISLGFIGLVGLVTLVRSKHYKAISQEIAQLGGSFMLAILAYFGIVTYYHYFDMATREVFVSYDIFRYISDFDTHQGPILLITFTVLVALSFVSLWSKRLGVLLIYYLYILFLPLVLMIQLSRGVSPYYTFCYMGLFIAYMLPLYVVYSWAKEGAQRKVFFFWWIFFITAIPYAVAVYIPFHIGLLYGTIALAYIGSQWHWEGMRRNAFLGLRFFSLLGLVIISITAPQFTYSFLNVSILGPDGQIFQQIILGLSTAGIFVLAIYALVKVPMRSIDRKASITLLFYFAFALLWAQGYHYLGAYQPYTYITDGPTSGQWMQLSWFTDYVFKWGNYGLVGLVAAGFIILGIYYKVISYFNIGLIELLIFTILVQGDIASMTISGLLLIGEGLFFVIANLYMWRHTKTKKENTL